MSDEITPADFRNAAACAVSPTMRTMLEMGAAALEREAEAKKLLVPNPCSVCHAPITQTDGQFVVRSVATLSATGDGSMRDGGSFAHYGCYWRKRADAALERCAKLELRYQELAGAAVTYERACKKFEERCAELERALRRASG